MMSTVQPKLLCDQTSCLIIIDLQERLTSAIPVNVIARLRKNTAILLKTANQLNVPVITTAQYPKGLGKIEPTIVDNLKDSANYFEKTCFSCLGAVGLGEHLTDLATKQLIITGIEAHICILQSAFDLLAAGYEVFVVTDAVAARKSSNYDAAIMRLTQANASMISTESVLFEWLRDASHPRFKSLSKLIL